MVTYEPNPRYSPVGGSVDIGWARAFDADIKTVEGSESVLSIDGPMIAPWEAVVSGLTAMLAERGIPVTTVDLREAAKPWGEVLELTTTPELANDPDFLKLPDVTLGDLLNLPAVPAVPGVVIIFGPGAALVDHDALWYADLPKRYAEADVVAGRGANIGQPWPDPKFTPTTKRLFYIDWPLLDAHRDAIRSDIIRFVDLQALVDDPDAAVPTIAGAVLRQTIDMLVEGPFRTRPTFNTTSWGGHWAQEELGMNTEARNTALGYELIAPEAGVLIGESARGQVEVPFLLIVAVHPERVLGPAVCKTFGTSFPIRFDYLDTHGGGNLSVHLHPRLDYMQEVFGWPYTQHETYYMMVGSPENEVFLGLQKNVDIDAFHAAAHAAHDDGTTFDITKYVNVFPAEQHQLFVIPAGTPHGSGKDNVVLEVSATPYLYSLRFYDWLRGDAEGNQRPVHVEHAFKNLNVNRTGKEVKKDLVQKPRTINEGPGWKEVVIGALPEMFFEVRRVELQGGTTAELTTDGRFRVYNVVEGSGVLLATAAGHRSRYAYAETFIIPAAVGPYSLTAMDGGPVHLVEALVP